jgi:hypothetical protein
MVYADLGRTDVADGFRTDATIDDASLQPAADSGGSDSEAQAADANDVSLQTAPDSGGFDSEAQAVDETACGPVTVANIPGLALWLVADMGVVTNGNNVASWTDQSGNRNNANQTTASRQPLFVSGALNGHAVVRFGFNGMQNALEVADAVTLQWGSDDFTIEMVARYTNPSPNALLYSKQAIPAPYVGAALWGNQLLASGAGVFSAQVEYKSGYFAGSAMRGLNDGLARLYGGRRTGGTDVETRINGLAVGAQVTPTVVDVSAVGIPVSLGLDVNNGEGSQQLDGDVAEIVAIHGTTAAADLACLESYLVSKYAL